MNIQKIYNAQIYTIPSSIKAGNLRMVNNRIATSGQLNTDTVSFQSRGVNKIVSNEVKALMARKEARALRDSRLIAELKNAPDKTAQTKKELLGEERTWGVGYSTAMQIREMILEPQKQIHNFMQNIFGDLKVSEFEPKNLLLNFSDRAKSIVSIMEKSATRKWNSVKEILDNMTDLNGAKIVLNYKTGKADAETVLDRLIPLIKTGTISLHEIELQRPEAIKKLGKKEQEEFDYVSKAFLDKLEDAQEEFINGLESDVDSIKLIDRPLPKYTKGNYCALHLILQINEKGSRPFELQIMGPRMAQGKCFDDKRFKFFDGKQLDSIYEKLIKLWEPLIDENNEAAKERFLTYCKDANFQLREDELREYKLQRIISRQNGLFKSVRDYNLPPEYDLNEQYKIMLDCEKNLNNKKSQKNKKQISTIIEEKKELFISRQSFNILIKKFKLKKAKDRDSGKLKY